MKLTFDPSEKFRPWYVITDDGGWDGAGATAMDAMAELICTLEKEFCNE